MNNELKLVLKGDTWHCVGWLAGERVRRSTKTSKHSEAVMQMAKWLADGEAGLTPKAAGLTVQSLVNNFLKRARKRPFHISVRNVIAEIERVFGHIPADALTTRIIEKEMSKFKSAHRRARISSMLRAIYKYAHNNDVVSVMPRVPVETPQSSRVRFLTSEELKRFLETLRAKNEASYWLCIFLAFTGVRRGEAILLKWSKVDLDRREVVVSSHKGVNADEKFRTVPLNDLALEAVRTQLKWRTVGVDEQVFRRNNGIPWVYSKRCLSAVPSWGDALEECGITNFRPHDLRHQFATMLRRDHRMPLDRIADMLGHADTKMTQRYAHLLVEDHRADIEKLKL